MNERFKDFNVLTGEVAEYLGSQLFFSPPSIEEYQKIWRRIRFFMDSRGYPHYCSDVEKELFQYHFNGRSKKELNVRETRLYNGIKMLLDFVNKGKVRLLVRPKLKQIVFDGPIGEIINSYIEYKKTVIRLHTISLSCHKRNLLKLHEYCTKHGIINIEEVDLAVLLQFVNQLDTQYKTGVQNTLMTVRGFTKYLFEQKILAKDYAQGIPRYKSVSQAKLPSTYTKEEIERLIASADRFSAIGKRNYAIILLAARLGLRASDICRLKFENLHWQTSTIKIHQYKTGKELVLPILADVGNALIDYLKYSRPVSEETFIFLTARIPYTSFFTSNVVTHVVQRAFIKAGIDIKNRRFGPHSLRHSLGFRMLEESTILPVISEVLGHKSTESTRYYLRIDLKSMKQCMVDVPPVAVGFYDQNGGVFYG
ncbi:site-specific integrase [Pedobacter sp. AW31-3R]|uniref:site-specific integrase n=1 Tax=Pedobacter sp. AW31-3R TaxID=3445781 RepID=UPI003F9F5BB9